MPKQLKFVVEQWLQQSLFNDKFQSFRHCLWYDGKRGRCGDSKFSNRPFTFESNRIGTSDSNSNRISKFRFAGP